MLKKYKISGENNEDRNLRNIAVAKRAGHQADCKRGLSTGSIASGGLGRIFCKYPYHIVLQ